MGGVGYGELKNDLTNDPKVNCTSTNGILDGIQFVIDIVGFVPGFGDLMDGLNALIYFSRGMPIDAFISLACAAFTVVADTVLKPLRSAIKSFDLLVQTAAKKIKGLQAGCISLLNSAKSGLKSVEWLIGKSNYNSIKNGFDSFISRINRAFKPISNEVVEDVAGETAEDIVEGGGSLLDELVLGKIPRKEYNRIRASSIKNSGKNKIMLGKYDGGGPNGYITKAGKDFEYFDLGSEYGEIMKKYDLSEAEMFEAFNLPFLEDAVSNGKTFHFSHDPTKDLGALGKEYEYLKASGYEWDSINMIMSL